MERFTVAMPGVSGAFTFSIPTYTIINIDILSHG
jgi:hypothetical protein